MKIFLDTVDFKAIEEFASYGILDGVTTNPSLMSSSPMDFRKTVTKITSIVKGDVSVEVAANDYEGMIREGNRILDISSRLVIKLPITWDGIKACDYFARKNVKVNMTLCFNLSQAMLSARVGAYYVSPFIGRLEDIGEDGIDLIADIRTAYNLHGIGTEILAASIRKLHHVEEVIMCGAHVVTLPVQILSEMIKHPLTDRGLRKFNEDWAKSGKTI